MKTKHTLVLHLSPDLEALFMVYLIRNFPAVREKLGVADRPALKFIPAGPLRREDWPGRQDLVAESIEADGFMFLDCGGGRLDQHDKHAVSNSMSSLDLLAHYCALDQIAPELMPLVEVISKNDISGKDIVRDDSYRRSATPHTPRHLRNVILGWNLIYKDRPEMVARLADTAFRGMAKNIEKRVIDILAEDLPTQERFEAVLGEIDHARLFLADELIQGVALHSGEAGQEVDNPELAAKMALGFRDSVEAALRAMENEWSRAVEDYWQGTQLVETTCVRQLNGAAVYRQITVAHGRSESTRFGAVTRLGNEGRKDRRPYSDKPVRTKADVTIQVQGEGRFIIATKGIELDKVARAVRRVDLMRKGVVLSDEDVQSLSRTGHLSFTNRVGERVQALYLAEYGTAFGNGFRANPHASAAALSIGELVKLVIDALKEV